MLNTGGGRQHAPAVTKILTHLCAGTRRLLNQVLEAWSVAKHAAGPLEEARPRERLAKLVGLLPVVRNAGLLMLLVVRHTMFGCCGAVYQGCLRVDSDRTGQSVHAGQAPPADTSAEQPTKQPPDTPSVHAESWASNRLSEGFDPEPRPPSSAMLASSADQPTDLLPNELRRLLRAAIKCTDRSKAMADKKMWSELADMHCGFADEVCHALRAV